MKQIQSQIKLGKSNRIVISKGNSIFVKISDKRIIDLSLVCGMYKAWGRCDPTENANVLTTILNEDYEVTKEYYDEIKETLSELFNMDLSSFEIPTN